MAETMNLTGKACFYFTMVLGFLRLIKFKILILEFIMNNSTVWNLMLGRLPYFLDEIVKLGLSIKFHQRPIKEIVKRL